MTDEQYYQELQERRDRNKIQHQAEFKEWLAKRPEIKLIDEVAGFRVGDKVTFTNDSGVVFPGHTILAIDAEEFYGRQIYLDYDCYWFPSNPKNLTKEN